MKKKRRKKKVTRARTAKAKPKRPHNIGANAVVVKSIVDPNAKVIGRARVRCSHVLDTAIVGDNAEVTDSWVTSRAVVSGDAKLFSDSMVCGSAKVSGNSGLNRSRASESAQIRTGALFDCHVFGHAVIGGGLIESPCLINASIGGQACVARTTDHLVIGPIGTRKDYLTAYRTVASGKPGIGVHTGCFTGTIDEFVKQVKERGVKDDPYIEAAALIRMHARAHDWYRRSE